MGEVKNGGKVQELYPDKFLKNNKHHLCLGTCWILHDIWARTIKSRVNCVYQSSAKSCV